MAPPAATNDELEEGVEAEPAKGGSKGLIITVVLLLVLGGGGFAAFKLLGGKEDPKGKEAAKKEQLLPARYVTLDPPFVVNFQAESAVRFLQITIGIMTRDLEIEKIIKDNDPRIRNDLSADPRQPELRHRFQARGQGRPAQALPREPSAR